ncbi:MAG: hypothetical protein JW885_08120 [Deltaproteobacteria bacterium]|nr:hypothetical protein [Candidatus Zymogenaceae bacterium]
MRRSGKLNRLKELIYQRPHADSSDTIRIDVGDVTDQLFKKSGSGSYFLNTYTEEALLKMCTEYGLSGALLERGFSDLHIDIEIRDLFEHRLRMSARNHDRISPPTDRGYLLMELLIKEGIFTPKTPPTGLRADSNIKLLMIMWLSLENPTISFTDDRPRLPGQRHPGLGVLKYLADVMRRFAGDLRVEGIVDVPEHYHGALMYSPLFFFFNPHMQGTFEAMSRDLVPYGLAVASYAVALECVVDEETGHYVSWDPGEQILPVSEHLKDYFSSREYREIVEETRRDRSFHVDMEKYQHEYPHRDFL